MKKVIKRHLVFKSRSQTELIKKIEKMTLNDCEPMEDVRYDTKVNVRKDGSLWIGCNCPGWIYHRKCWHTARLAELMEKQEGVEVFKNEQTRILEVIV